MAWLRGAVDRRDLAALDKLGTNRQRPGARIPLDQSATDALSPVTRLIQNLDRDMVPVRLIAFDKTPETNWVLPWHQDRVIAVDAKHDVSGFHNWSRKHGVWHCEPPVSLLKHMLFVRVHLDDSGAETGAMEIAVGSQNAGRVPAEDAETVANSYPHHICTAQRGDILVLNMLTLHRSLPAAMPTTRRVLRIDYAAADLPTPLVWAK